MNGVSAFGEIQQIRCIIETAASFPVSHSRSLRNIMALADQGKYSYYIWGSQKSPYARATEMTASRTITMIGIFLTVPLLQILTVQGWTEAPPLSCVRPLMTFWFVWGLNSTYPVVGNLESLQVWAGEVRSWEETRCYPVGGKWQRRPVKDLLLPLCAQIQHLEKWTGNGDRWSHFSA